MQPSQNAINNLYNVINKLNFNDNNDNEYMMSKQFPNDSITNCYQNEKINQRYKKDLHQKLAQACQQVFQTLLSINQRNFKQEISQLQKGSYLSSQIQYSQEFIQQYGPQIYSLHKQMHKHPKYYIKLKNILKIPKITNIFQSQISFIYNSQTQARVQQIQIILLRRAIRQKSKKLWASYQYVRYLDFYKIKKLANHTIRLFYIDGLKSSMVSKDKILQIFQLQQVEVQFIETDDSPQVELPSHQFQYQEQMAQMEEHKNYEIKDEIQDKKRNRIKNMKNSSFSAWICLKVKVNGQCNNIKTKIKDVTQKILKRRQQIEQKYDIQIQNCEEYEQNQQLSQLLIDGFNQLSINPHLSHQKNYLNQELTNKMEEEDFQSDDSTQLLFRYDNSLFFNF